MAIPDALSPTGSGSWLYLAFGVVLVLILLETFPRVGGSVLAVLVVSILILNARGLSAGPRLV